VEVKFRIECSELDFVEKKLKSLSFSYVEEKVEEDLYFNSPVRDFKKSDEALRLRKDNSGVKLTYKGKKIDSETKTREEITVGVDDFERAKELLQRLGFYPVRKIRKKRKIYERNGIFACVDAVDGLGCFLELEIDLESSQVNKVDEAKNELMGIARKIGVEESITKSYLEMIEGI